MTLTIALPERYFHIRRNKHTIFHQIIPTNFRGHCGKRQANMKTCDKAKNFTSEDFADRLEEKVKSLKNSLANVSCAYIAAPTSELKFILLTAQHMAERLVWIMQLQRMHFCMVWYAYCSHEYVHGFPGKFHSSKNYVVIAPGKEGILRFILCWVSFSHMLRIVSRTAIIWDADVSH